MPDENAPDFAGYRLLHAMIRVRDLEQSIAFYATHLGMKLLRRSEHEAGRFTLAFLGYGDEDSHTVIELTYNWDQKQPYALGSAFGHLAVAVPDIYGACARMEKAGVKIPRPPGPMKGGRRPIAFIEDPDGYRIELIERA